MANEAASPRTLFVLQGTGGGIGRAELLLLDACGQAADGQAAPVAVIEKSVRPGYLIGSSAPGRAGSRPALAFRSLAAAATHRPDVIVLGHLHFVTLAPFLRAVAPGVRI